MNKGDMSKVFYYLTNDYLKQDGDLLLHCPAQSKILQTSPLPSRNG